MSATLPTSNATRKKRKRARLLEAVTAANAEKIAKCLTSCDPNFIDDNTGETPLSLSITNVSQTTSTIQRVIVALINGGALIDFRTKDGRTALHCAVQKSNYVALKTLLDLGASPNYRDGHNLTPLFYTILYKSNSKLTQLLLFEHSVHGVMDQQGWQEIHHACKLGLVAHLEQLLYYGCDMNCKILGSGNTPLHVAAINDQMDCARILLMRGCNTEITNNSHQNAYQVAVISGNLTLSELIANHKPENVIPYRDKPKYNPARRPPSSAQHFDPAKQQQQALKEEYTKKYLNGTGAGTNFCPPVSPCPSQRSCNTSITVSTTTTSSGVCCELDSSQSEEQVDEGINSEDDSTATTERTISSHQSRIEGRREQKIQGRSCSATLQPRGRREQTLANQACRSDLDHTPFGTLPITYREKTVSLQKNKKGFGFVLRGDHATSPFLKQIQTQLQPISLQYLDEIEAGGVAEAAGLKKGDFLLNVNKVDVRSSPHETVVSLIRQSGEKVTMTVASPVFATLDNEPKFKSMSSKKLDLSQSDAILNAGSSNTLPRDMQSSLESRERSKVRNKAPPTPPKRDPSTTLSIGRAKAKSLGISESSSSLATSALTAATSTTATSTATTLSSSSSSSSLPSTTTAAAAATVSPTVVAAPVKNQPLSYDNEEDIKLIDDDSESKSAKSSSTATSIESMVCNSVQKLNKISSANQEKTNGTFSNLIKEKAAKITGANNFVSGSKRKKNERLKKDFHSTPDIPKEMENEKNKLSSDSKNSRLSSSQDVLTSNAKVTKANDQTNHRPPSPSNDSKTNTLSIVVKVDVGGKHSKNDTSNFAQIKTEKGRTKVEPISVSHSISSFKPDSPLSVEDGQNCDYNSANFKGQENLDPVVRQKPFIPDPDYSSEEEALKNVRTESLSTFKSSPAVPCNKQHPPLPPVKMAQSYHGDMSSGDKKFATNTKSIMSSSAVGLNSSQVTNHSVKSKVQSLAEGVQKQLNGESTLKPKKKECDPCLPAQGNVKSKLESLNKVKGSLMAFEAQSRALNESARLIKPVNTQVSCVQMSSDGKDANLKVSKSCFEVDCCDNSSSGVSSDVDAEIYFSQPSAKMTHIDQSTYHDSSLSRTRNAVLNNVSSATLSSRLHMPVKGVDQSTQSLLTLANAKSAPLTTKTWSEISSAIRAAKETPAQSSSIHSRPNFVSIKLLILFNKF